MNRDATPRRRALPALPRLKAWSSGIDRVPPQLLRDTRCKRLAHARSAQGRAERGCGYDLCSSRGDSNRAVRRMERISRHRPWSTSNHSSVCTTIPPALIALPAVSSVTADASLPRTSGDLVVSTERRVLSELCHATTHARNQRRHQPDVRPASTATSTNRATPGNGDFRAALDARPRSNGELSRAGPPRPARTR